jgi:hypothetical protein
MKRPAIAALAVLLAVSGLVAPVVAQDASTPDEPRNATGEYTLDELKQGGTTVSGAPASVRMTQRKQFWVIHWPASAVGSNPGEDDQWAHVEPGSRVDRNAVYLRSIVLEQETVHVKVVSWRRGTKTVSEGNTTTQEPVARNVTVRTHEVTLNRGWPMVEVPLPQHNRETQVTMFIEEYPGARWRFEHKSVATTQNAGIESEGDYLVSLLMDVLVWVIGGGFVVGIVCKKALDRAGRGPGYGYGPWIVLLTVGTAIGGFIAFESLAEVIVAAPTVLAAYTVAVFAVILLETYTSNVRKVQFEQLDVEHSTTPSGEEGYGWRSTATTTEDVVRMPDGRDAVVRRGLMPFLARVFGKAATLRNQGEIAHRIEDTGPSAVDERILVHPDAEEVLHYEPESFKWAWEHESDDPHEETGTTEIAGYEVAKTAFAGLATTTLVGLVLANPLPSGLGLLGAVGAVLFQPLALVAGAVAVLVVGREAVPGEALVVPAPSHMETAYATTAMLAELAEDADTIDEFKRLYRRERIKSQKDVEEALEKRDQTLVEGMFDLEDGDLDPEVASDIQARIEQLGDLDEDDRQFVEAVMNGHDSGGGSDAE